MINDFATRPLLAVGVALALSGVPSVWAQVPSAGQVMRDIESLAPAPLPSAPVQVDMPPPSAPSQATPGGGMQMQVKGFEIAGNQVFGREQLLELLADLPGQSLDLAGLRAAAQRITEYYQAHGYALARAFLPAQDIDQGIVRIQVLEGHYGRIELNNRSRVIDAVLQQPLSALRPGEAVYDADLEQSLLLLSDLPGVAVKGTLRPGSLPGSTDLVVDAEPGPWYAGTLEADNYGDRYTGEYRLGASLVLNNPLRLGD
ncbi:MAG: ShlB/FhaC/HecB family hemolysin secretion/activation protein, partial [Pseudomonas paracarnis]